MASVKDFKVKTEAIILAVNPRGVKHRFTAWVYSNEGGEYLSGVFSPFQCVPSGIFRRALFPFHQEILMSSDPQEGLVASVTRFFKQALSTISGKAEPVIEEVREAAHTAQASAGAAVDEIKANMSEVTEKVAESYEQVVKDIEEAVPEVLDKAQETISEALEQVDATFDEARSVVGEAVDQAISHAELKVESAKEELHHLESKAAEHLETLKEKAGEAVESVEAALKETLSGSDDHKTS